VNFADVSLGDDTRQATRPCLSTTPFKRRIFDARTKCPLWRGVRVATGCGADSGTTFPVDLPRIASRLPYSRPRAETVRLWTPGLHASRVLKAEGYSVLSRETEGVGYDLEAARGSQILQVEVKGITGSEMKLPITVGELNRAKEDPRFRLFALTEARERSARVHRLIGNEFVSRFGFKPLSYFASRRKRVLHKAIVEAAFFSWFSASQHLKSTKAQEPHR
jgi:Domain of unknown function (DUF3883)